MVLTMFKHFYTGTFSLFLFAFFCAFLYPYLQNSSLKTWKTIRGVLWPLHPVLCSWQYYSLFLSC